MNVWQTLYFEPGTLVKEPDRSPDWQRGRYLVAGLGHCNGCHRARATFGAKDDAPDAAGTIIHGWYAPPLVDPDQAGLQHWSLADAAHFLQGGESDHAAMMGPTADVVYNSDARAMATYLRSIPAQQVTSPERLLRLSEGGRQQAMTLDN